MTPREAADQAVFQLQFNTRDAVRYIMRNAHVTAEDAERALKAVVVPQH